MRDGPNAWYWFVRNLVRYGYFVPGGGFRVFGVARVPSDGALIVAPNHVSTLDPPVIACAMPRRISFMAKKELFDRPLFGSLIRSLGSFPVQRGEADTEAIRLALSLLEGGRALLVFPEGTRGNGEAMLPVNRGVAMLARRSGATVLPVGIVGTHLKMPRGRAFPRFRRVEVEFGEPFTYAEIGIHPTERENREAFAKELERRILGLCQARGYDLRASESGSQTADLPPRSEASESKSSATA